MTATEISDELIAKIDEHCAARSQEGRHCSRTEFIDLVLRSRLMPETVEEFVPWPGAEKQTGGPE